MTRSTAGLSALAYPELTRGDLIVLDLQRIDDVHRRQVVFIQQVAIQPDAHSVLRAEQLHIAHAVEAANRIFDIGGNIVRNIVRVVVGLSEIKPATNRKLLLDFSTLIPCCCTSWGSSGVASCSLFCTCTGNIGIGTRFKGERNGYRTGRVAGRRHIHQIVDAVHILLDNLVTVSCTVWASAPG